MLQTTPPITLLMVAYNAEKYISAAITSILNQSFKDFELLIIDDGSTDRTKDIVSSFEDPRIILHKCHHDYIASLNFGIENARGKYVARTDADDLLHRDRLRIQYSIMEAEPSIDICGTWMTTFSDDLKDGTCLSTLKGVIDKPLKILFQGNYFYHPTMMFRMSFFRKYNLLYQRYAYAEDYKLWFEASKLGAHFYVEPQSLYYYRVSSDQVSRNKKKEQNETSIKIKKEILLFLLSKLKNKSELQGVYHTMQELEKKNIIKSEIIIAFFMAIFNSETEVYHQK